jgi:hypothetical protein
MKIEDIYKVEKGVYYINRPVDGKKQNGFTACYKIVGYMKDTRYLIGLLDKNQGFSFNNIQRDNSNIIEVNNKEEMSRLIYINIGCLGKYPREKIILRRKKNKDINEVKIDFSFSGK